MSSCAGDDDGAFDQFLASDFAEILLISRGVGEDGVDVDGGRLQGQLAGQKPDGLGQRADANDFDLFDHGGFGGRSRGAGSNRSAFAQSAGLGDGHYGSSKGGQIDIATGHSTGQQAKTLCHELVHEVTHRPADGGVDPNTFREIREVEAEAVAYVVCRHFGLDAELRAVRYITLWGGDAKKLAGSLSRISETAKGLIEEVETVIDGVDKQFAAGPPVTPGLPDEKGTLQAA